MKILVTGSSGYLGRELISSFLKMNFDLNLILLVRDVNVESEIQYYSIYNKSKNINVSVSSLNIFYSYNLFVNNNKNSSIFYKENKNIFDDLDFVIHTATDYGTNSCVEDVYNFNVHFPQILYQTILKYSNAIFINIDTYYSLFNSFDHLHSYGLTKKFFQNIGMLSNFNNGSQNLRFLNCRVFHLYGISYQPGRFISDCIDSCIEGKDILLTHGMQRRDFIFIDDVVSIILNIISILRIKEYKVPPNIDIGTSLLHSIKDVAELIHKISKSNSKLLFGAIPDRINEPADVAADKFCSELLNFKFTSLNTGLTLAIENFKNIRLNCSKYT